VQDEVMILLASSSGFPIHRVDWYLQYLPSVIEMVRGAQDLDAAGVETVAYDIFAEKQTVEDLLSDIDLFSKANVCVSGALVHYFNTVLQD
jgi:hypothetical protein